MHRAGISSVRAKLERTTYLHFSGRMPDADDAAHDSRCRGNVVAIAAVAAEPEQDEQNSKEEDAAQRYDCYQPRVVEVCTPNTITNLLHRCKKTSK